MIEEGVESLDDGKLVVEFCGERRELAVGSALTFGRQADLCIDSNPYLHRVMGRFVSRQGLWWLQNFAVKTAIEVRDRGGSSRLVLLARQQAVLARGTSIVTFALGPANYELLVERNGVDTVQPDDDLDDPEGDGLTIPLPFVPLSSEQHMLIVALAERRLLHGDPDLPSNLAVASRLDWTLTKFNRKLDHLCEKVKRETGIPFPGNKRRERLVSYAIASGLVSEDDLGLLSPAD